MLLCEGKTPGLLGRLTGKKFLAPLLVLTLLVCHGAFGGLHQLAVQAGPSVAAMEAHSSHAVAPPEEGAASDEDLGALGYSAALLSILVMVLWLRLWSTRRWHGVLLSLSLRERYPRAALRYPRGPTFSLLQVLRL